MSRPTALDLTRPHERWREVEMPGANAPLTLVRLHSAEDTLAMYARFPAGFERAAAGGYDGPEEFVVLDGELVLDGVALHRGELTYVPAREVRRSMRSDVGCTVIAWFGGLAQFRPVADLAAPEPGEHRRSVSVLEATPGVVLDVSPAMWSVVTSDAGVAEDADVLDLDLRTWSLGGSPAADIAPRLVRTRH